jgi:putative tryptophan/tyrosine transport system substrate-binding protein
VETHGLGVAEDRRLAEDRLGAQPAHGDGGMMIISTALAVVLGLGILVTPLAAEAQPAGRGWRIGLFHVGLDHVPPSLDGLREGLTALGYEEGKNIHLDWRNLADEEAARATAQAFVRERVDLIVAFENQTVRAVTAATTKIPVVMLHVTAPVEDGFIKSFAHPGGNVTGFAGLGESPSKEVELFKELIPRLKRLLVLFDAGDPASSRWLADARQAATKLKLELVERQTGTRADIERVFAAIKPADVDGVFISSPDLRTRFLALILELASNRRLPLQGHRREWVEQGALFSYNLDLRSVGKAAARYVDKILKGTKPADLPVEQSSQLQLIINLKTAKALGLTIPPSLLARAHQIIE